MRKLITEKGSISRFGYTLPQTAIDEYSPDSIPQNLLRKDKYTAPSLNEYDVAEHYRDIAECANVNYIESGYVQSIIEDTALYDGFTGIHPYQLADAGQGAFELLHTLRHMLCDMFGMDMFALGTVSKRETILCVLEMVKAYFKYKEAGKNTVVIDSSVCKRIISCVKDAGYNVDIANIKEDDPKNYLNGKVLAVIVCEGMLKTDIADMIHDVGAVAVLDGKNMKRFTGKARPGDMGYDIIYFNMGEMFTISDINSSDSAFAIGVSEAFADYIPAPVVEIDDLEQYYFDYNRSKSVGKPNEFYGNFTSWIKSLGYILSLGFDGFVNVSETVALNTAYAAKLHNSDKTVNESVDKQRLDENA